MHKTNINFGSKKWIRNIPNIETQTKKILKNSIQLKKKLKIKNTEISILLTDTDDMKKINTKFRNKKSDTDVLSFPSQHPSFFKKKIKLNKIYLGDLALSFGYIQKQKTNFEDYYKKILVHGFLHLIGYDHDNKKNYLLMEKAHKKILNTL